jgi:hypothetical protein
MNPGRTIRIELGNTVDNNNKPDKHFITTSAVIPARRERVYALIANYHDGHPRIVPEQFSGLVVEQGGDRRRNGDSFSDERVRQEADTSPCGQRTRTGPGASRDRS